MIDFKMVTPDGIIWDGPVDSVNLKTTMGEITVLPQHVPLIATVEKGVVRIESNNNSYNSKCDGGVLEVKKGSEVVLLAGNASKFLEV
jgi:F-type H+-transporting ATPase subunit epsilon